MPIYEYRCKKCDREFEVIQKVSDSPLRKCRGCSGRLEKLVSRSSFQLKGSGWYVTDYARKPAGPAKEKEKEKAKTEAGSKAKSETDSGGKSDTASGEN
jgi:putative FmdB family regulatory protein